MTDAQQFEAFLKNYQDLVFSTAMRLLANQAEAEDVSQEVFLKAYQRFADLCDNPAAGGWLKTVTRNMCLNHLSRYRSRWSFFSELFSPNRSDPEEGEPEYPSDDNLAEKLERSDRCAIVEQALQSLPEAYRVPLVLYHLEELSYDEIAEKLGVSLGKVKTDIFRGRELLRKKLERKLESESTTRHP